MSDIRDFGGVGDGQADNREAISHALAHHDGVVSFPKGEYLISQTIEVNLNEQGPITLEGLGGAARIKMAGSGPAIKLVGQHSATADPSHVQPVTWSRERCPIIRNLEIFGAHPESDGVELVGCWQPNLIGLSIHNVRNGIRLAVRNRNVIVDRCHIYHNSAVGIFFDRVNLHQTNITGSHISYNRLGGIRIEESEIRNLQITGNDIEYNNAASHDVPESDRSQPTAEIYLDCGEAGSMREITIASNTIQATASLGGSNIRLIGTKDVNHRIGMLTISGNLIGSQETNVFATRCRGLVLSGNYIYGAEFRNVVLEDCENVTCTGNCIGANPDYQVPVRQVGVRLVDCDGVSLTGDIVEGMSPIDPTQVSESFDPARALVEIVRSRGIMLTGCQLIDAIPAAIDVDGGSAIAIQNCQMTDRRNEQHREWTVRWQGSGNANAIRNCLVAAGRQGSFRIEDESHVEQVGNTEWSR